MKSTLWPFFTLTLFTFWSCNGDDQKAPASQLAPELYLDYKVSAEEAAEYAVVLLYFRDGGRNGNAVALEEGSQVSFDGEPLTADSARLTGVYYEAQRPLAGFAGSHTIVYKDKEGREYKQAFQFTPLTLESLPPVLSRQDLSLRLGESAGKSRIQVLVTDTSFETADINEEYMATNGEIIITHDELNNVVSGPITLELVKEEVQPLANGRLVINYTLRRELELR